jgi:DNA-binding SARP family transcriptional activator/pimeloyl-ACP methyl ester carboxylesterase
MAMLGFLGAPSYEDGQRRIALNLRPKALALLAYVALAGHPVSRRELRRLIFPDVDEPASSLRWHLANLRRVLPAPVAACLRGTRETLSIEISTDVAAFRAAATRTLHGFEPTLAREAVDLYHGDLLSGLGVKAAPDFETWLYVEQEQLRQLFRRVVVTLARWLIDEGSAEEAVDPLGRLLSVDLYCEDAHTLLIEAYLNHGDRQNAEAAYARYERIVRDELQAEPRPETQRLLARRPGHGRPLPRDGFLTLREITLHVVEWPANGPTIVALHGVGAGAYVFSALAERLQPDIRVIAMDLRGRGYSDKPASGYGLVHEVDDVLQLIVALGLERPILLGHSSGGTICTFVATRTSLGGIVLMDATIGDRAFTENAIAHLAPVLDKQTKERFADLEQYIKLYRAQREMSDEAERMLDRFMYFNLARLPDGTYRRRLLTQAVVEEWASLASADTLGELSRVRCPILICQSLRPWLGGLPYYDEGTVVAQLRAAPKAELVKAANSHHVSLPRDPEPNVVAAIRSFAHRVADERPPQPAGAAADPR